MIWLFFWSELPCIMQRRWCVMRRFDFNIPEELFNQIKLMANFYKVPVSKMMIQLLEIGYLGMLKMEGYDYR